MKSVARRQTVRRKSKRIKVAGVVLKEKWGGVREGGTQSYEQLI